MAGGAFVAFLDSDDYWAPGFLEEQLELFARVPTLDLVYCDAWICGDSPLASRRFMELSPSDGPATLAALLTCKCTVVTSGVLARADVLRAAGGFDPILRRGQDFDLWLRLARRGARLGYQRKPLVYRRVHDRNLSADPIVEHQRVIDVLTLPRWCTLSAAEDALVAQRVAWHRGALALESGKRALANGRFAEARAHLATAAAVSNGWKLRVARLAIAVTPHMFRVLSLRRTVRGTRRAAETTNTALGPSAPPVQSAAACNLAELGPAS